MKNICYLLVIILSIAACQKEQAPQINITITTTPSTKWKMAQFKISDFSFLTQGEETSASIGGSILQQWEGVQFEQDLTRNETNLITENEHWAMNLVGVKPYLTADVVDQLTENTQRIEVDNSILMIELTDTYLIEDNQTYTIDIKIDTDAAFVEENGKIYLDWSKVTASVTSL